MKLCGKFVEPVVFNGFTHVIHKLQVIVKIMDRTELRPENFADTVQMMNVGTGKMTTGVTLAGFIQWFAVVLISGVADSDIAKACEKPSVAGIPGWHDAVEHVDAIGNPGNQIFRSADAHQIMGHVCRQARPDMGQDTVHLFLWFTHGKTADGNAVESHL